MDKESSIIDQIEAMEVSIYREGDVTESMDSFSARVKTYYSHDRKGIFLEQQQDYRLSLKIINGELFSRFDFSGEDFSDMRSRSILTGSEETVCLLSETGSIENRYPLFSDNKRFSLYTNEGIPFNGRLPLDEIKSNATRLSFDIDESTPGIMNINYPAEYLPSALSAGNYTESYTSYKISLDIVQEIMISSELKTIDSEGIEVTSTIYPVYQKEGDDFIQIGSVTEVFTDFPYSLDVDDSVVKSYESVEDIPLVSEEELERMVEEGTVFPGDTEIWLGDLSDSDFMETFIEIYEDVQINTLQDSLFRAIM